MRQRLLIQLGLLEALALTLANLQGIAGVHTDEAKYLLDIPYPHGPVGRGLFHILEWFPAQEMFWRFLLATLLVQAFWLVWDIGHDLPHRDRSALALSWLFSAALLTQAGSLMMAPITALQVLVLVWAESRLPAYSERKKKNETFEVRGRYSAYVALFWLVALFTAHQAVLFLPLTWSVLTRLHRPTFEKCLYVFAPLLALVLYIVAHPLLLAIFAVHAGTAGALSSRLVTIVWFWVVAGSFFGSLAALFGLYRGSSGGVKLSFILLTASCIQAGFSYYIILFVPLFIAGLHSAFHRYHLHKLPYIPLLSAAALVLIGFSQTWFIQTDARRVTKLIDARAGTGTLLIHGNFGHEWQYENRRPVLRFQPGLLKNAKAVVCTTSCRDVALPGFTLVQKVPKGFTGELWMHSSGAKQP